MRTTRISGSTMHGCILEPTRKLQASITALLENTQPKPQAHCFRQNGYVCIFCPPLSYSLQRKMPERAREYKDERKD